MKRLFSIFSALLIILTYGVCLSGEMKLYNFPFAGRWQPSVEPFLIDDYGFQDIQNLKRTGNGLKGVDGYTKINTSIINSTYYYPRAGFHFKKDNPSESHILLHAFNSDESASRLYENTTLVPSQGDFSSTTVYTPTNGSRAGRFSIAPGGHVIFCDGKESVIWGGNEARIAAFITSTAAITDTITNAKNCTSLLSNSDTSENTTIAHAAAKYFVVGSYRPLKGVKFYVSSANASSASLTVEEWDGSAWSGLTETDNTSGLAESASVTWATTESTSKKKMLEGYHLYWYQFTLSAGSADVYYVTVDAAMQDIRNIWDGSTLVVASCKVHDGTNYTDYSDEVNDDTTSYYAVLDSLTAGNGVYLGFTQPISGFDIYILSGKGNSTANTTMTVKYWNGSAWTSVGTIVDETSANSISLAQSGSVTFQTLAKGTEYEKAIAGEAPLYYYQITFDENLDAEVEVWHIRGIPTVYDPSTYEFSAIFQNRAILFNDIYGHKNEARYSVENSPDIWNGNDSGYLYFGDDREVTAAAVIYNVFRTTGYEQLIVTKENETYRLTGEAPWTTTKMSGNIGCTAPGSMTVCDTTEVEQGIQRQVAIWQASHGFVMCDGATIQTISNDVQCYFDANDTRYILPRKLDDTQAWYDPNTENYHVLISSGDDFDIADTWGGSDAWPSGDVWGTDLVASIVTHNVELVYNVKNKEWFKTHREDSSGAQPLHIGFNVVNNHGKVFSYGGSDNGFVYRLENGNDWDGTAIAQYVWTKDLLLDENIFTHTRIAHLRLIFKTKSTGSTEDISIAHYGDQTLTTHGSNNQYVPTDIDIANGPHETRDCNLGMFLLHSFKFSVSTSSVSGGMELDGMALYYETWKTIISGQ